MDFIGPWHWYLVDFSVTFSQASVILFTGGRGCVCVADIPLGRHPPGQTPPTRWLLEWTVRVLLECILVRNSVQKFVWLRNVSVYVMFNRFRAETLDFTPITY